MSKKKSYTFDGKELECTGETITIEGEEWEICRWKKGKQGKK